MLFFRDGGDNKRRILGSVVVKWGEKNGKTPGNKQPWIYLPQIQLSSRRDLNSGLRSSHASDLPTELPWRKSDSMRLYNWRRLCNCITFWKTRLAEKDSSTRYLGITLRDKVSSPPLARQVLSQVVVLIPRAAYNLLLVGLRLRLSEPIGRGVKERAVLYKYYRNLRQGRVITKFSRPKLSSTCYKKLPPGS